MNSEVPSYTRGYETYYDIAGLSILGAMRVGAVAGWTGAKTFDSTRMDCPLWVKRQVLARKEQNNLEFCQEHSFSEQRQEDLFKPRRMLGIGPVDKKDSVKNEKRLEWRCDYCQMINDGEPKTCRHCGAPKD